MSKLRERQTGGRETLEGVRDQRGEPQIETASHREIYQPGAEQHQNLAQIDMDGWKKAAQGRQLRVLVAGLGGVGKSTLINQLLYLKKDGERAKEGRGGRATTLVVSKHERTTEKGMKVCIFDSPGFGDLDIEDEDIITMMESETEKKLDVVFYCISLSGPCRVQREDAHAIKILTQVFSANIWKRAVIVLTFANVLETDANIANYQAAITNIQEKVGQVLRKDPLISEKIIAQLPIVTAGHTDPILKYEVEKCKSTGGWDNHLFLKALEQIDPAVVPTLFEARYNWKALTASSTAASVAGAISPGLVSKVSSTTGTHEIAMPIPGFPMLLRILVKNLLSG